MFKKYTYLIIIVSSIFFNNLIWGQRYHLINNGAAITIKSGAYFIVSGDFINNPDASLSLTNPDSGYIDLDGKLIVGGDWINNAEKTNVFVNIESVPNGEVHLNGIALQNIGGINKTNFENFTISKMEKKLLTDDNSVNGIFKVNAVFNLNSNMFIINNPNGNAIQYLGKYIYAETGPNLGYGTIRWNIKGNIDTYKVPFGSGLTYYNDLNLSLTTKTSGFPTNGYIDFSTYPATCLNLPLPDGVINFTEYDVNATADRFWYIHSQYTQKPTVDITFTYSEFDIEPNCNQTLVETDLKGIRHNAFLNTWADISPRGYSDKFSNTVTVEDISDPDFFDNWTLTTFGSKPVIWIPNAFKPDENGRNDFWGPRGYDLSNCQIDLFIYSRWGEVIFESHDFNYQWDGRIGGEEIAPIGVYPYQIFITDDNGNRYEYNGHVTLIN